MGIFPRVCDYCFEAGFGELLSDHACEKSEFDTKNRRNLHAIRSLWSVGEGLIFLCDLYTTTEMLKMLFRHINGQESIPRFGG